MPRSISSALALAAALLAATPATADEQRRVVVAEFDGPSPSAEVAQEAVQDIVSDFYEVLPYSRFQVARRRLNVTREDVKAFAKVARQVGADAIIDGELAGRLLTVSVREGRTGRVVDRFQVKVDGRSLRASTRELLIDELVDLIDATQPIADDPADAGALGDPLTRDPGAASARTSTAAAISELPPGSPGTAAPPPTTVATATQTQPKAKPRPPAIEVRGAVGVAAVARQLAFSHQLDLAEEERPLGMSGSPSAGAAFSGTFDVKPIGLSADVLYRRSVGASVSFPSGGQTKQLGVSLSHAAARLVGRRRLGQRFTVRGGVGYHQLAFAVTSRPVGFLIPDARYAYVDLGAGGRLGLRDDRLAFTADLSYLHVLGASGITDETSYGTSAFQGYGAEVGFEIQSSASTYVRLAGTYDRILLSFAGDGALSTGLDDSSDVDVSAAADAFTCWSVMLGFRL